VRGECGERCAGEAVSVGWGEVNEKNKFKNILTASKRVMRWVKENSKVGGKRRG